jgi:hypothetical protein
MLGILLFSQDEQLHRIAADALKLIVIGDSSRQDTPSAVACVSLPNPCSLSHSSRTTEIQPLAGQPASHGADFDVPLDVRKIRYQPISNGCEGCASDYFPDDMI